MRKIYILGAASGWGSKDPRCEYGPELLLEDKDLSALLEANGLLIDGYEVIYTEHRLQEKKRSLSEVLPLIVSFNQKFAHEVEETLIRKQFPLILGGDHSISIGTWSGVMHYLHKKGKTLGLLWIDTHMDAHTLETSHSKMWCGMPVAALLGHGIDELKKVYPDQTYLQPEHVCELGIRSFEKEEKELLDRLGVRIYYMDEIRKKGFPKSLEEAVSQLVSKVDFFGISMDLDVLDPTIAPGVACREKNGVFREEVLEAFSLIHNHPKLIAFGLVEFNPYLDEKSKTEKIIPELINSILGEKQVWEQKKLSA